MHNVKKIICIAVLFINLLSNLFAQNKNIHEIQLLQSGTNIPIQYAHILWHDANNLKLKGSLISNLQGTFILEKNTSDLLILSISCIGYESVYDTIKLSRTHTIYLKEDILKLEQVTVTGTRTTHTLNNAPVLTQIVSQKEIENMNATTALEVLETEFPGIEISQHGYGPTLNMQGLGANYTLILIDGERIAGETDGNVDFSKINTANMERIEVVRGTSSTLHGSSAMGGVINIITKNPKKKLDIKFDLKYGQLNQKNYSENDLNIENDGDYRLYLRNHDLPNLNGNLNIGLKNKNLYSNTFINFKSTDAYQLYDSKGITKYYIAYDTTIIDNGYIGQPTMGISGFMDYTISQKVGFDNGKKWRHELNGNYYNHEEFDFDNNSKHNLNTSYTIGEKTIYSFSQNSSLNFSINQDTYNKYDALDKSKNRNHVYRQSFNHTKINYTGTIGKSHSIFVGIENFLEMLETDMFDSTATMSGKNANNAILIIQDEYKLSEKLMIVAGIRNSWHSAYNYNLTPSLIAKYTLNPFNLRLSYARGFRSPSLKELYMKWDHLGMFEIIGDPNMKPENSNYYSFSADYINSTQKLNLTTITSYNHIFNKIEGYWSGNNQDKYIYTNLSEQSIFNVETILRWKLIKKILLKGGYVYTQILENRDYENLSVISPHAFTAQLDYNYKIKKYELNINISGKYTGKKTYQVLTDTDDYYPETYYIVEYPAYSTWNLAINQQYSNYNIIIGIKNMFNYTASIANFNTSASPGRRFFLTLGYKF